MSRQGLQGSYPCSQFRQILPCQPHIKPHSVVTHISESSKFSQYYLSTIQITMGNRSIPLFVKSQAIALTEIAGFTNEAATVALRNAISAKQIGRIRRTAIERGWHPIDNPALEEAHLVDKPRSGRPRKHNEA